LIDCSPHIFNFFSAEISKEESAEEPKSTVSLFNSPSKLSIKSSGGALPQPAQITAKITVKAKDTLFDPPVSTFEPTMKEANVPNVNTIPGEDVFYFDCRLLPQYKNKDVLAIVREQVRTMQKKYRVKISLEIPQNESSPSTSADSPVVEALSKAIVKVRKVKPRVRGVGGGTVAAYFRRKGIDSVVWETNEETAHTINEYIKIDNLVADAKVFAMFSAISGIQ